MDETQVITTEESQRAAASETAIIQLKEHIQGGYIEFGRQLKEFRDNKYHLLRGYSTLNEWLSAPEVTIAATWCYRAIAVYELYVLQLGKTPDELRGIDYTKLASILPIVKKHPEQVDEWLSKASGLRRIDLQSEIKTQRISDRVEKIESLKTIEPIENIIHGDPVEEVQKIQDGSVGLVIMAPDPSVQPFVLQELFSEFRRVLKPNGSVFIFVEALNLLEAANAMGMNDFHLVRDIVLTYSNAKENLGINTLLPYHETVLWASRGDTPVYNLTDVERDIWAVPTIVDNEHPMTKDMTTIMKIIKMASDEGEVVLDPFMGSGTIIHAAKTMGRNFIGIEQDELWYKLTLEKIHTE